MTNQSLLCQLYTAIILVTLYTVGYAIGHVCIYIVLPDKKCPEKYLCCFSFALRHNECEYQLPDHSRSSTIPVSLLVLLYPLAVARFRGQKCGVLTTLGIWSHASSYLLQRLLRLDIVCIAECQQLQHCSIVPHAVLWSACSLCTEYMYVFFGTIVDYQASSET